MVDEATRAARAEAIRRPRPTATAILTTRASVRERRVVAGRHTGTSRGAPAEATRLPPSTHRLAVVTDRHPPPRSDGLSSGGPERQDRSGPIRLMASPLDARMIRPCQIM